MDLLGAYGSGSDSESDAAKAAQAPPVAFKKPPALNAAPSVQLDLKEKGAHLVDPRKKDLQYNPRAEDLWQPLAGPANPFKKNSLGSAQGAVQNTLTGFVEKAHIDNFAFEDQYNTFMRAGYAADPSMELALTATHNRQAKHLVGNQANVQRLGGQTVSLMPKVPLTQEQKELRKKRKELSGNTEDPDSFRGPWASYLFEEEEAPQVPTEEQKAFLAQIGAKRRRQRGQEGGPKKEENEEGELVEVKEDDWETSEFHGDKLKDYQGRSWLAPPPEAKSQEHQCYIPKKWIHTWSGHQKGVSRIKWFPTSAHLLLSASMDKTVKIWSVYGSKRCMQTYSGHKEAVKDVDFDFDGKHFVSASYDKTVKYWDTETGQVISRFHLGKVPHVVKFHPDENKSNQFLVGQNNKIITQWDVRTKEMMQKYDEHLGPVNTITFVDNNRRFVTTSDDKKALIWEYGIPVVVKHISEPEMHSMPFVGLHPSGKSWVGQSQDNQLLVYGATNRMKVNTKKRFTGHLCAGYAIQVDFSPDGRYVMSGDAEGRVFFWDWRTSKLYKKMKAHDQVTIGCIWHPHEPSKVATCSWDGTIKFWD